MKTFYHYVLTYRGASDEKGAFAEAVFEDVAFPKASTSFDELSAYVEMQADPAMQASVFDTIWSAYCLKYNTDEFE